MISLKVNLGERSYPICIGQGLLDRGELLTQYIPGNSALIVTNEVVAPLYAAQIETALHDIKYKTFILPDGEQYKSQDTLNSIYDCLLSNRFDRNTTLIALGGGVVGDITGFAAASYQRGVHFVQIPTTLLAQVDSSVGGKTGINHALGKNMIGAFYQPRTVIADTSTLSTLEDRELSAGIAEVIKYGLIRDLPFLEWLEKNMDKLLSRDPQALAAADERESGQRALLNLGHTFGHAIETGMGYGNWLHGEAVASGMVMAARLSEKLGWINDDDVTRVIDLIERANLPVKAPLQMTVDKFLELMAIDKKVSDGVLHLILFKAIGKAVFTSDYDKKNLIAAIEASY